MRAGAAVALLGMASRIERQSTSAHRLREGSQPREVAGLAFLSLGNWARGRRRMPSAHALTGDEVMMRSLQVRAPGDSASSMLRVELRTKDGASVTRTVETYRKDCDGASRQLVVMRAPADVAGAAFLSWIHPDRYPDMWLYLPELGRPRQLNPATRGESFMGSDFTYEDLGAPARDERTHRDRGRAGAWTGARVSGGEPAARQRLYSAS